MNTRQSRLDISGMTCANCAGTITDRVTALDGVTAASINFATDEGTVEYDPDRVSLGEVYDAVDDAGYDPIAETLTVPVTDMSCANCAETITEALLSTPGVVDADVNYATDEAQVRYNPNDADREAIVAAIESAGYTPVREGQSSEGDAAGDGESAADVAHREAIRRQRRLTLFGAVLSTPLLVMMADHLLALGLVPETVGGIAIGWVAFALATPVQIVLGRDFYENSYEALVKNRRANMDVLIVMGSSTAYVYSVMALLGLVESAGLYFDTAAPA